MNHRRNERSFVGLRDIPYHISVIMNDIEEDGLWMSVGECSMLNFDGDV